MKCLILAAGYATRLYPLTLNFPKPLLKVKDKTIVDWLIEDLNNLKVIDEYYVVTNHKYIDEFNKWNHYENLVIFDDGTTSNESRLGALKDIELVLDKQEVNDDLLIVAGDNLLDFSLGNFIKYYKDKNTSCVMRFYQQDKEKLKSTGVAQVNENDLIINMQEKPKQPIGNYVIPPFYIIKKDDLAYIKKAINEGVNVDAPGSFISYLASKTKVYAYLMEGDRYDIGNIDSYNYANANYKKNNKIKRD